MFSLTPTNYNLAVVMGEKCKPHPNGTFKNVRKAHQMYASKKEGGTDVSFSGYRPLTLAQ